MNKRITIYIDEENARRLERYDSKSQVTKEALNLFFSNKTYYKTKKELIEERIKELKFNLKKEELKLKEVEEELDLIELRDIRRPKKYEESVKILKELTEVNRHDLIFQAERLGVNINQLKNWL